MILILAAVVTLVLMSTKFHPGCLFGHRWGIHDLASENECWWKIYGKDHPREGQRVTGSEYTKVRHFSVMKCLRCGRETATLYYGTEIKPTEVTMVTPDFARGNINRIRVNQKAKNGTGGDQATPPLSDPGTDLVQLIPDHGSDDSFGKAVAEIIYPKGGG